MANGRTLPSPLAGLGDAALLFTQLRADREERRRQREREEKAEEKEKRLAAARLLFDIAPLLPTDTPVGETFAASLIPEAFSNFDEDFQSGIGGLVLNPQTLDNLVKQEMLDFTREEGLSDTLLARSLNAQLLGTSASSEELKANRIDAVQAIEFHDRIKSDPKLNEIALRKHMNLPGEVVTLEFGGQTFENVPVSTAANIGAGFEQLRLQLIARNANEAKTTRLDLAKELVAAADKAGIGIQRPLASRIIIAHEQQAVVNFPEGEGPLDRLRAQFSSAGKDSAVRAIDLYSGAITQSQEATSSFFSQTPQGVAFEALARLRGFAESIGKMSDEEAKEFTNAALESGAVEIPGISVREPGFLGTVGNLLSPGQPFGTGSPEFRDPTQGVIPQAPERDLSPSQQAAVDPTQIPDEVALNSAAQMVAEGLLTEGDLARILGGDQEKMIEILARARALQMISQAREGGFDGNQP